MDVRIKRKLRRERIIQVYKEHYCRPFYEAIKQNSNSVEELNARISAFTLGVHMADPHGKWHKSFNKACDDVMKEVLGESDVYLRREIERE